MSSNHQQSAPLTYHELNHSILSEHNKIRTNPKSYIPILTEQIKLFKENVLYRPNEIPIQTNESPEAYHEAIKFFLKKKPQYVN